MILLLIFGVASQTKAHPGRTNSSGCHSGSQPYHCHNSKTPSYEYKDDEPDTSFKKSYRTEPRKPYRYNPIDPNPPKNKVTAFYDKITESIVYGLKLIHKKPYIVKSCEEWVMVMKLMTTIAPMTPKLLATLEGKCYDAGHRRFGRYMRKRIERLPIKLSE